MEENNVKVMEITAFFDGLCEPVNPGGVAAYGVSIVVDGAEKWTDKGVVGEGRGMSNNVAEYAALCAAIDLIEKTYAREELLSITFTGDSQLVINQMNGAWQAKGGMYFSYHERARETLYWLDNQTNWSATFKWVPRELNQRADALSREAYEGWCMGKGKVVKYMATAKTAAGLTPLNVAPADTCMNCKWLKERGPHVGCYPNGNYLKWLSKSFARYNKCEKHEKK
jgi:ribonuclease HI